MIPSSDESQIRHVIAECVDGAADGDFDRIRPHLAPDILYLLVGEPPLQGPDAFLALLKTLWDHCRLEPEAEIREFKLMGDHAYCLNWLSLTLSPRNGEVPRRRSGYTMTLLRKEPSGAWVVFRNLNMLTEL